MKRRTLLQMLGGLLAGLGVHVEPVRENIREVVVRAKAAFSPLARWRYVKPEEVVAATLKGDEELGVSAVQHGLKVAEVLSPACQTTRIGNDDEYLAAMLRAEGVEVVKGANVREVIDNNHEAMYQRELREGDPRTMMYEGIPDLNPDADSWFPDRKA